MQLSFERSLEEAVQSARYAIANEPFGWSQRITLLVFAMLGGLLSATLTGPRGADLEFPTLAMAAVGAVVGIGFAMLLLSKRRSMDRYLPVLIDELGPWPRTESWQLSETGLTLDVYESSHFIPWDHLRAVRRTVHGLILDWRTTGLYFLPNRMISDEVLAAIPMQVESN